MGFDRVWVRVMCAWFPGRVLAGSESQACGFKYKAGFWMGSSSSTWFQVPIWGKQFQNQSILKEINPQYSTEGLMLKLKLQCFDHLMQRTDSLQKTLILGRIEGRRRRRWQRIRWLDLTVMMASLTLWIWIWAISGNWWWTRRPGVLQSTGWQRVGHDWATKLRFSFADCLLILKWIEYFDWIKIFSNVRILQRPDISLWLGKAYLKLIN